MRPSPSPGPDSSGGSLHRARGPQRGRHSRPLHAGASGPTHCPGGHWRISAVFARDVGRAPTLTPTVHPWPASPWEPVSLIGVCGPGEAQQRRLSLRVPPRAPVSRAGHCQEAGRRRVRGPGGRWEPWRQTCRVALPHPAATILTPACQSPLSKPGKTGHTRASGPGPRLTWKGTDGRGRARGAGNKVAPSLGCIRLSGGVLGKPHLLRPCLPCGVEHSPTAQCPQAMMALSTRPTQRLRIRETSRVPASHGKLPSVPSLQTGPGSIADARCWPESLGFSQGHRPHPPVSHPHAPVPHPAPQT